MTLTFQFCRKSHCKNQVRRECCQVDVSYMMSDISLARTIFKSNFSVNLSCWVSVINYDVRAINYFRVSRPLTRFYIFEFRRDCATDPEVNIYRPYFKISTTVCYAGFVLLVPVVHSWLNFLAR